MALLDAYVSADQFRAATGDSATGTDSTLNAQLLGVSRLLERALGLPPGAFNSASDQTLYLDAYGGDLLRFRDERGFQWFVQSVDADGIGIDSENDGTYDGHTLDLGDAWVVGWPANAEAGGEPYRGLRLLTFLGTCNPSSWPSRKRAVRIQCTTGWAAVPQIITDLVIHRTQELREGLKAGASGDIPAFDAGVPLRPSTTWLFQEAERLYGHRLPAVA